MIRTTLTLTAAALVASGALQADTPTPNPTGWEVAPSPGASLTADTLTMKTKEATNPGGGGVEYAFIGYDPDGTGPLVAPPHRLWNANPVGVVSGLNPGQTYAWRILVRDNVTDDNRTEYSEPMSGVAAADTTLPTVSSWANSVYDGPIGEDQLQVTYTVTFSENLLTNLTLADFEVVGTSFISGTVNSVTKTSAVTEAAPYPQAVYDVVVDVNVAAHSETVGDPVGTLQLKIPGTAVIEDPATKLLVVPVSDPTVITVNSGDTPETAGEDRFWDGGTINLTGMTDGVSQGGDGTWNLSTANWDRGAGFADPIAWNNSKALIAHIGGDFPNWAQVNHHPERNFPDEVNFIVGPILTLDADIALGGMVIDPELGGPHNHADSGWPAPKNGQNYSIGSVGETHALNFAPGSLIDVLEVDATFRAAITGAPDINHMGKVVFDPNYGDGHLTLAPTNGATMEIGAMTKVPRPSHNKPESFILGGNTSGNIVESITGANVYKMDLSNGGADGSDWTITQNLISYTMTVVEGTLICSGTNNLISSGISIADGGRLVAGDDWDSGSFVVENGGTIAPGSGVETLTVTCGGDFDLQGLSFYEWEVGASATDIIHLKKGGSNPVALVLGDGGSDVAVLKVVNAGGTPVEADELTVFTYDADVNTPDTATLNANVYIQLTNDWTGTPSLVNDGVGRIYVTGLVRNIGGSDLNAPEVDRLSPDYGFNPATGLTNVPQDSNLVLTFNEDIAAGTLVPGTSFITLKNLSDASQVQIDITDGSQVSISGPVLTINPSADLAWDGDYAVQIDATAIDDLAGNSFAGIGDDITWAFAAPRLPVGILFSDGFENPDVDLTYTVADTSRQVDETKWVSSGNQSGIVDEGENGGTNFTDPVGAQAYGTRYSSCGATTADAVISRLHAGFTYTVTFDVVTDNVHPLGWPGDGTPYNVGLVTFAPGAARNDTRYNPSYNLGGLGNGVSDVLAWASGDASGASYETISFSYTADGTEGVLGDDLAVRISGAAHSAIIDNVVVTGAYVAGVGNDFGTWIGGYPGVGGLTAFTDDPDGDGLDSGLEAFFGTDPSVSNAGLAQVSMSGNTVTFEHPNPDAVDIVTDVTGSYEWSIDMVTWYKDDGVEGPGATTVTTVATPDNPDPNVTTVEATIGGTVPTKLFLRVVATQAP